MMKHLHGQDKLDEAIKILCSIKEYKIDRKTGPELLHMIKIAQDLLVTEVKIKALQLAEDFKNTHKNFKDYDN